MENLIYFNHCNSHSCQVARELHYHAMRSLLNLSILTLIVMLSACANTTGKSNHKLEGGYRLIALQDINIPQNVVILLRVADETLSGKGPVNQWSAQIVDGKIGGMISTRMAGPTELMQIESQLFDALIGSSIKANGANSIRIVKDKKTVAEAVMVKPPASR